MKGLKAFIEAIKKAFFYPKWRCVSCGKEVFDGEYFCADCKEKLPFIEGAFCEHCGRKTIADENYCSTCKGNLTETDRARSVFNYEKPISTLIKKAKYKNERYILDVFSEYLAGAYFKNYFSSDIIVYVPMTKKAEKKRGYNQSKILAVNVAESVGVPIFDVLEKTKDTKRQAKLTAKDRRQNLIDAFKVKDKKAVADKKVLIIDDVTTTGSTAEAIAIKLKKAGAKSVELLTVASVPPKDKY